MQNPTIQENLEAIDMNALWNSCKLEDYIFNVDKVRKL